MMNIIVNLKYKKALIIRIIGTIIGLCALSVGASYLFGMAAERFMYYLIAGFSVVLLFRLAIDKMIKLRKFLSITDDPDIPKHNQKVMLRSLVKYLACLFILPVFTYGIIAYPMVVLWVYALLFTRKYIQVWKYHGYSVRLLVGLSGITVITSVLLSPFVRPIIWAVALVFLKIFNIL